MRNALLLLPLIILSLVLAGCGNQEQATTTNDDVASGGEPTSVAVEHQPETSIVEYEVRITEEGFFPSTYTINDGDTLRLVFLLDEAHFVTIEDIGFAEEVQRSTLDLDFPAAGEYDLICLDCEDKPLAVVSVQ